MTSKQTMASLNYGLGVFFLLSVMFPLWCDFGLWIPFVLAVPLLYLHCGNARYNRFCAGLLASLPGLIFPLFVYGIACFAWQAVLQARAEGGLYCVMTCGKVDRCIG